MILAGAFGAYALGANNIANVMGVFVHSSPFTEFSVSDLFTVSSVQQLFLLGAIAIAVGVYTYSKNVMMTVGGGILALSPVASWVVVVAQSLVLFLFASVSLEHFLASHNLPTFPLVPVSSSQAVVGAVIGIGLLQGGRNIKWSVLGNISLGWLATPLIAAGICFVSLFFLQNVFNQDVFQVVHYRVTEPVIEKIAHQGFDTAGIRPLVGQTFDSEMKLMDTLAKQTELPYQKRYQIAEIAKVAPVRIDHDKLVEVRQSKMLDQDQINALAELEGESFDYPWSWMFRAKSTINKLYNMDLQTKLNFVLSTFSLTSQHGA